MCHMISASSLRSRQPYVDNAMHHGTWSVAVNNGPEETSLVLTDLQCSTVTARKSPSGSGRRSSLNDTMTGTEKYLVCQW